MYSVDVIVKQANECTTQSKSGKWVALRPIPLSSLWFRLSEAWAVFTGKADAVYWPDGDGGFQQWKF